MNKTGRKHQAESLHRTIAAQIRRAEMGAEERRKRQQILRLQTGRKQS